MKQRTLWLALALVFSWPLAASAQCSGQFPAGSICGAPTAGLPKATPFSTFGRPKLTAALTIYVNGNAAPATCAANSAVTSFTCAAGNDTTGNGTTAAPYLTLQKGITAARTYDWFGFQPTIVLAYTTAGSAGALNYGGTFGTGASIGGQVTGGNALFITGDLNSPTSVSITAPNTGAPLAEGLRGIDGFVARLEYLKLDNQGTATAGLHVSQQAIVDLWGVTCGASWTGTTGVCVQIDKGGIVNSAGDPLLTLAGCGGAFLLMTGGVFNINGANTIAIPSAIACNTATVIATGHAELIGFANTTFAGAGVAGTTGTRALLAGAAYVNYSGASSVNSVFPGSVNAILQNWASTNHAGDTINIPGSIRVKLFADKSFFVNGSTGSDSNFCTSSAAPCLTIQGAVDIVHNNYDLGGFTATINIAAGTYTGGVSISEPWIGGVNTLPSSSLAPVILLGDTTTPSNVTLTTVGINVSGASIDLRGLKLTGVGIVAGRHGTVYINGNMDYGAFPTGAHLFAGFLGVLVVNADYTISGSANYHTRSNNNGALSCAGRTITLTGTPAWGSAFAWAQMAGTSTISGNTYVGAATGKRYNVISNSVIDTGGGGANYFPGDVAGTTASGGQYL